MNIAISSRSGACCPWPFTHHTNYREIRAKFKVSSKQKNGAPYVHLRQSHRRWRPVQSIFSNLPASEGRFNYAKFGAPLDIDVHASTDRSNQVARYFQQGHGYPHSYAFVGNSRSELLSVISSSRIHIRGARLSLSRKHLPSVTYCLYSYKPVWCFMNSSSLFTVHFEKLGRSSPTKSRIQTTRRTLAKDVRVPRRNVHLHGRTCCKGSKPQNLAVSSVTGYRISVVMRVICAVKSVLGTWSPC